MTPLAVVWDVNPVAFNIFGIDIAWYGVMWSLSLAVGYWLFSRILRHEGLDPRMADSAFFYVIFSTVIGARLGHCLFYEPADYFLHPFMSDFPWIKLLDMRGGGLASHGAALGILVGLWLYCRKWHVPYIWSLDRIGIIVAVTGAMIRFGNLMNSEIYGTATDLPWGFVFVRTGEVVPMHPTQIYEAVAYLLLFGVLAWLFWKTETRNRRGVLFGIFITWLFAARFVIETIKQPQVSFEQGMSLNMGQWLSLPFIVAGIIILVIALQRAPKPYEGMPQPDSHLHKRQQKKGKK